MRVLVILLLIAACTYPPPRDPVPDPVQLKPEPEAPKPAPAKPVFITVNPPAKPQGICVPLAVDQKKRILEALECAIEAEKAKK